MIIKGKLSHACPIPVAARSKAQISAARLLILWVLITPRAWMSVCCECCVLSGGGLCDELITRPEEPYRLCCVVVCDLETSWKKRPWSTGSCCAINKQTHTLVAMYRSIAFTCVFETYLGVVNTCLGVWQGLCVQSAVSASSLSPSIALCISVKYVWIDDYVNIVKIWFVWRNKLLQCVIAFAV
jgi:hypothetical protein